MSNGESMGDAVKWRRITMEEIKYSRHYTRTKAGKNIMRPIDYERRAEAQKRWDSMPWYMKVLWSFGWYN